MKFNNLNEIYRSTALAHLPNYHKNMFLFFGPPEEADFVLFDAIKHECILLSTFITHNNEDVVNVATVSGRSLSIAFVCE